MMQFETSTFGAIFGKICLKMGTSMNEFEQARLECFTKHTRC